MPPSSPPALTAPETDLRPLAALLTGATPPPAFTPPEIDGLTENAVKHSVAPLLYHQLEHAGVDVTSDAWSALHTAYKKEVRRYLQRKAAFQKIEPTLQAQGIPTLWLKGFAFAHTVYPNPALRPMRDLDVLVPYADRERALALVQGLGYTEKIPSHSTATQAMWHHYSLGSAVALELHYNLIGWRSKILPAGQLPWFRAQTYLIRHDDLEFMGLTPEAGLLYLSAHAILQHGELEFLLQRYLDLHLIISRTAVLDWRLIVERAVTLRWTYAVERALELTAHYFQTPLPAWVPAELRARRPADEAGDEILYRAPDNTRLHATQRWMRSMSRAEQWNWVWGSLFPSPAFMRWRYKLHSNWKLPQSYLYRWGIIAGDTLRTMLKWVIRS